MGAVVSLIVFAVGAILRFATNFHSATWNIRTIGDILMIVGVVGFVMAVVSFVYWDGFGVAGMARHRRTTVTRPPAEPVRGPDGYARTTYGPAGYGRPLYGPDGIDRGVAEAGTVPAEAGAEPAEVVDPTRQFGTVVEEEERSVY